MKLFYFVAKNDEQIDLSPFLHILKTSIVYDEKIKAIRKSKLIFTVEGSAWEPVSEYSLCLMPSGQFFIYILWGKKCSEIVQ